MDKTKDFINNSKLGEKIEKQVGSESLIELLNEFKKFIQGNTGRPTKYNLDEVSNVFRKVEKGEVTPTKAREQIGISKTQYYKMLKDYKNNSSEIIKELTKKCRSCKIEKPLSEFRADKKGKLGVRGSCKECEGRKKDESL